MVAKAGEESYPKAKRVVITADSGGSNSSRNRLWKLELQRFADKTGLVVEVCHYPPGTSKWNKIEHRLFCHITRNWQGVPLETHEIVVESIGNTKTTEGLEVHVWLDESSYEKGRKVSDQELDECVSFATSSTASGTMKFIQGQENIGNLFFAAPKRNAAVGRAPIHPLDGGQRYAVFVGIVGNVGVVLSFDFRDGGPMRARRTSRQTPVHKLEERDGLG